MDSNGHLRNIINVISKRKELARVNGKGLYIPIDIYRSKHLFCFWVLMRLAHSFTQNNIFLKLTRIDNNCLKKSSVSTCI